MVNLGDRIVEAEESPWLGEVEGLKISLAAAEDKLASLEEIDAPVPSVLLKMHPTRTLPSPGTPTLAQQEVCV